jgi:hypothetical protein
VAVRFDVLHDRTAIALREPDGVEDDLEQHVVEHQGRAHGLSNLAQSLQLLHLAGEFEPPSLQSPNEVDVPDGSGGLGSERPEHRCGRFVKRFHFGPPQADRADHLVVDDERR